MNDPIPKPNFLPSMSSNAVFRIKHRHEKKKKCEPNFLIWCISNLNHSQMQFNLHKDALHRRSTFELTQGEEHAIIQNTSLILFNVRFAFESWYDGHSTHTPDFKTSEILYWICIMYFHELKFVLLFTSNMMPMCLKFKRTASEMNKYVPVYTDAICVIKNQV